ncbi:hypothetical protein SVAN01_04957 [Stagonosporopsis vannaccii]|nr:hypothetical protein SVAN01_04957 [Stagonosporopsis vannaccii]
MSDSVRCASMSEVHIYFALPSLLQNTVFNAVVHNSNRELPFIDSKEPPAAGDAALSPDALREVAAQQCSRRNAKDRWWKRWKAGVNVVGVPSGYEQALWKWASDAGGNAPQSTPTMESLRLRAYASLQPVADTTRDDSTIFNAVQHIAVTDADDGRLGHTRIRGYERWGLPAPTGGFVRRRVGCWRKHIDSAVRLVLAAGKQGSDVVLRSFRHVKGIRKSFGGLKGLAAPTALRHTAGPDGSHFPPPQCGNPPTRSRTSNNMTSAIRTDAFSLGAASGLEKRRPDRQLQIFQRGQTNQCMRQIFPEVGRALASHYGFKEIADLAHEQALQAFKALAVESLFPSSMWGPFQGHYARPRNARSCS